MTQTLTLRRPDDWHLHLRDGAMLDAVLPHTAAHFARAIIMDPKILFCDEPSAGLDPVVASALDDLILDMRAAMGMTIVVVTHELESAFKIADRLTILDKGHILMIGTVDEVRKSKNERVQNLLNRMPEDDTIDPDEYLGRLTGEEIGGDATL